MWASFSITMISQSYSRGSTIILSLRSTVRGLFHKWPTRVVKDDSDRVESSGNCAAQTAIVTRSQAPARGKDRATKKCRVPFARNSPFGCFAQKVPDTYVSLIANEMSWRLAPPYLGSAGRSQRCIAFPGGSLGTRGIGNAANTVAIAKTANPTWRCPAIVDQAAQVGALQLLSKEQLENKVVHRC